MDIVEEYGPFPHAFIELLTERLANQKDVYSLDTYDDGMIVTLEDRSTGKLFLFEIRADLSGVYDDEAAWLEGTQ